MLPNVTKCHQKTKKHPRDAGKVQDPYSCVKGQPGKQEIYVSQFFISLFVFQREVDVFREKSARGGMFEAVIRIPICDAA
jgi:hypothetical protein